MRDRWITRQELDALLMSFKPGKDLDKGIRKPELSASGRGKGSPRLFAILKCGWPAGGRVQNSLMKMETVLYEMSKTVVHGVKNTDGDYRHVKYPSPSAKRKNADEDDACDEEVKRLDNSLDRLNKRIAERDLGDALYVYRIGLMIAYIVDPLIVACLRRVDARTLCPQSIRKVKRTVIVALLLCGTSEDRERAKKADSYARYGSLPRLQQVLPEAGIPPAAIQCLLARKRPPQELLFPVPALATVPELPTTGVLGRRDLRKRLVRRLIPEKTPTLHRIGIYGMPEIGKSTLMADVVRENKGKTRDCFNGQIYWVQVGKELDKTDILSKLIYGVTGQKSAVAEPEDVEKAFVEIFTERRCLIVLDDIWHAQQVRFFAERPEASCVVAISRSKDLVTVELKDRNPIEVPTLDPNCARELLLKSVNSRDRDERIVAAVLDKCGGIPLAILLAGNMANRYPGGLDTVRKILDDSDLNHVHALLRSYVGPDKAHDEKGRVVLFNVIDASVEHLAHHVKPLYLRLATIPGKAVIPAAALGTIWGCNAPEVKILATDLADDSLATFHDGRLSLHDMLHAYLVCRAKMEHRLPSLHADLLAAYAKECCRLAVIPEGTEPTPWHKGPPDGYFFQNILYHMVQVGQEKEVRRLLLDYQWLEAKLRFTDCHTLLADFDVVKADTETLFVRGALQLSMNALREDKSQLPGQILGRLTGFGEPDILSLTSQAARCRGKAWLRPLCPCLISPGKALVSVTKQHAPVSACSFSADGNHLACALGDGSIVVWELGTSTAVATIQLSSGQGHHSATALALFRGTSRLACGTSDGSMLVYDVSTAVLVKELVAHDCAITCLTASTAGDLLFTADDNGIIKIWNTTALETDAQAAAVVLESIGRSSIEALAFSAARKVLFTSDSGVWDITSKTPVGALEDACAITCLALNADETRVAAGDKYGYISVWDTGTRHLLMRWSEKKVTGPAVTDVTFTPDGKIVAGIKPNRIVVVDPDTKQQLAGFKAHESTVVAVKAASYGPYLGSVSVKDVRIWDTRKIQGSDLLAGKASRVVALAVSDSNSEIVSISTMGEVTIRDLSSLKTARAYNLVRDGDSLTYWQPTPAISSDGRWLACLDRDNRLRVFDIVAHSEVRMRLKKRFAEADHICISASGLSLVIHRDHKLLSYNLSSDALNEILIQPLDKPTATHLSPDGRVLACTLEMGRIAVYDMEQARPPLLIDIGHRWAYNHLIRVSLDGSALVCGGIMGPMVSITGIPARPLVWHWNEKMFGSIVALGINGGGSMAVSVSDGNIMRVHNLITYELIARLDLDFRVDMVEMNSRGDYIIATADFDAVCAFHLESA